MTCKATQMAHISQTEIWSQKHLKMLKLWLCACLSVRCRMKPDRLTSMYQNKACLGVHLVHLIGTVLTHPAAARYEHGRLKHGSACPMLLAVLVYGVVYRPYE